jgi:hypothetical protein
MAIYRGEGGAGDATADASNAAALADSFADAANASAGQAATSASAALAAQIAAELAETNAETAETNAEAAEAAAVVAKNAAEAVLLDTGFTVVASDLQGTDTIGTVAADIVNVNEVANNIAAVIAVDANEANINIVAADGTDIGTVATSIADVNSVADNILDVTAVADNETNIDTVAANNTNITTVAGISGNVTTVAGISANVTTVATNDTNVTTVATNIANVNSVGTNIANVNSVAGNATNINAVAGNSTNINTVAGISANVTTVATNNANVTTVAGSIANVNTNATNIANINQNAANIVAIQNASANATAAASSATAAAGSATSASASAAAASAVALGDEPVRHSVRPSLLLDFANTKTLDPRITFTRASTASFYDGKTVAKAEENLLERSQEFDNAYWLKLNSTVTANAATAPDGTSTAEKIFETTDNTAHNIAVDANKITITNGQTYACSVFAKAAEVTLLQLTLGASASQAYANFDLSAGAVVGSGGSPVSTSIVDVGGGWYRCILVATSVVTTTSGGILFGPTNSSSSTRRAAYVGNASNGVLVWGAQLEQRSAASAYTPTTTAPITNYIPALQSAASGVARFEHNPVTGESLGLEIEEQRTNLRTYSDDFSNAAWSKDNVTIASNTIIAPDGTLIGDAIVENTANSSHSISGSTTVTAGLHTVTLYAKAAGRTRFRIREGTTGGFADFNLASPSSNMVSVGNGWFRCSVSLTPASTNFILQVYVADASNNLTYTGNGFSGIYIWGAQLEAGAFATSYIPTVASQVTRLADVAQMTGSNFSSWFRTDEGTVYSEFLLQPPSGNFPSPWTITDSTALGSAPPNRIQPYQNSTKTSLGFDVTTNGTNQANILTTVSDMGANFTKNAVVFKVNDFASSSNAGTVGTDTAGVLSSSYTQLTIGRDLQTTSSKTGSLVKKIAFYPRRLTNAELQGLTTV